jgi:hypothetical protein
MDAEDKPKDHLENLFWAVFWVFLIGGAVSGWLSMLRSLAMLGK